MAKDSWLPDTLKLLDVFPDESVGNYTILTLKSLKGFMIVGGSSRTSTMMDSCVFYSLIN